MNHIPQFNRRSFVVGAGAAGSGLALGLAIPFGGPQVVRAQDGSPELNAWVVIRPDDTVVIRMARSEMGQGTITGLAQLVAEELECDWSKVTTEYPTPGQSVARKRVWGDFSTGGSRGIRQSHEYVRKGGATARVMLIQAAANEWKVPAAECTAADSVITHTPSGRKTTFGKVAEAAAKLEPPADVKLKDPKDWKIAGKPLKRLDTPDKVTGKQVYGFDLKLPGMLVATIKDCPVTGGKVTELRCRQGHRHEGRQEGRAGRRHRGGCRGRHLLAGQDRARCPADRLGRGPEQERLERDNRPVAEGRPRRARGLRRQPERRCQGRDRRRRPRRSRPSTAIPTRTTPAWSR